MYAKKTKKNHRQKNNIYTFSKLCVLDARQPSLSKSLFVVDRYHDEKMRLLISATKHREKELKQDTISFDRGGTCHMFFAWHRVLL
jgi:hypothetical protein